MPKKVDLNKKAQYVALEIMKIGEPISPSQIDAHVGTGKYSSKYISFLKRDGFAFQINKDGRNVVSYVLLSKPDAATLPAGSVAKVKVPKVAAQKKPKSVKLAKAAKVKEKPTVKEDTDFVLPEKKKVKAKIQDVFEEILNEEPTSYNVDNDWDEINPQDDPRELA